MWATDRTPSWPQRARGACMAGLCAILPIAPSAQPAQAPKPIVSEADVARAAKSQPVITDQDIERAARKNRMPTDAELARVPVPAAPRLDALPQPLTQRRIDLGAIAKGYEAMGQPAPGATTINEAPALLVFVSFSMPDATLARLVDQAARARATLVLRGLVDGSLQKTVLLVVAAIAATVATAGTIRTRHAQVPFLRAPAAAAAVAVAPAIRQGPSGRGADRP